MFLLCTCMFILFYLVCFVPDHTRIKDGMYTGMKDVGINQCLRCHFRYWSATHQPMEDSIKKSILVPYEKGEWNNISPQMAALIIQTKAWLAV